MPASITLLRPQRTSSVEPSADPPARHPDFVHRRNRAIAAARRLNDQVDALMFCDPQDIHYLTGTREGISWLVIHEGASFAVTRHMLVDEVRDQAVNSEILLASARSTDRPDIEQFVIREMCRRGLAHAVIDPANLTAQTGLVLSRHAVATRIEIHYVAGLLVGVRAVKDSHEIAVTRRCVAIAEEAFSGLLENGAGNLIGRSERDLANELETRMWALGADRQGFPGTGIIVASGPNSAKPHHITGKRRIMAGESLLIDWGAELVGYRSDMTRTVFPSRVPDFAHHAYPTVEKALLRAAGYLRAGATMGEIDRAARETVTDAGFPEFHYGVGHGVGLAIHEAPWLRAHSCESCEADMLTTLEPGIYLPGVGGIRIENLYRVTHDGYECFGNLPTDMASMIVE
ncbi:MAG: M24 family metallopeptidase [Verrucomicrobiota bacterium]